jgi:hypothetical protein
VVEGETSGTEEVAGGVVGATRGAKVEAGVIGATCGMKVEAGVSVVVHGAREVAGAVERAGGLPEGVVGPSASVTRAVRPPGGAV